MKRTFMYLVAFGLLACSLWAQAPNLSVTVSSDGRWATVTNRYSQVATEYDVRAYPLRQGRRERLGILVDSVGAGSASLAPGASRRFNLPPNSSPVGVDGVIYADGATAGEPAMVEYMTELRQQELDDIPTIEAALRDLAAQPSSATQVIATLQARAGARGAESIPGAAAAGLGPHDRLYTSTAHLLAGAVAGRRSIADFVRGRLQVLSSIHGRLRHSKPALQLN